ncbi:sialin-like isoform X2 [Panulirus ornatus]|uniref:sialin-like isoform X2 n=1 Tax=Panulirus ornatus TaxID=150431 RepID=UPI003A8440BB
MGKRVEKLLISTFGFIPARIALGALSLLGFACLYMLRVNISVAIVAMVRRNRTDVQAARAYCTEHVLDNITAEDGNTTATQGDDDSILLEDQGEMEWDELTQGIMLSSYYYGYILTQIIGGHLADLYGTRLMFGGCILSSGICTLLLPVAARTHNVAFITLRAIIGFCSGVSWPSMHSMLTRWIPPLERPRFIAIVYFASSLSVTFTLPMCGLVIDLYGWASAFYLTGMLSVAWCILWFPLMHDNPAQHPRIKSEELSYIKVALAAGGSSKTSSKKVPWRQILTSLPVWAAVVADSGNTFGLTLFLTQLPTYMKNILGFSIKKNGLLSGLPFLSRYIGALTCSTIADWLLGRGYLSIVNTRRIFSAFAMLVPAVLLIIVAYSGCNAPLVVVLLCLSMFFNGGSPASILVNSTDIAPNYSGTLFGIGNTFASLASLIAPLAAGAITEDQKTMGQWQKVFWMCIPVYGLADLFFLIFCSGTIQPWNYAGQEYQGSPNEAEKIIAPKQQEESS